MLLNFYRFSVVCIVPFSLFRRLNLIFPAGISNQPADGGGRGLSYDFKAGGKNFTLPPDLLSNKQHVSGHPSVQITPCQRPALGLCDGQQTGGREEPSPVFSERARHRDGRPLGAACAPGSTRRPATFLLFAGNLVTAWPQTSRTPSIGGLLWKPPVVTAELPFFSAWFKKRKKKDSATDGSGCCHFSGNEIVPRVRKRAVIIMLTELFASSCASPRKHSRRCDPSPGIQLTLRETARFAYTHKHYGMI